MRLLLDTHALIWWLSNSSRLGRRAREAIADGESSVFVSAVSAMETCTKYRLGKMPEAEWLARNFEAEIEREGFAELPISIRHGELAGSLPIVHGDPFDRLLIAQAQIEQMYLVSNEALFDQFGVLRIW